MRCAFRGSFLRRSVLLCLLALVLCLAAAPPAEAGFNRWTSGGPWVGNIPAFAADPSDPLIAYASAQYNGIFRTRDGGVTWTAINEGLYGADRTLYPLWITSLAIDPSAPSTIYAGSYGFFVYKSTDGGDHWVSLYVIDNASNYSLVQGLTIDPTNPATVYAATQGGVWKTTDGGCAWNPANQGLPPGGFVGALSVAVDPANPQVLFLGTSGNGLYRSGNGGDSWTRVLEVPSYQRINGFAVDPANPSIVYAASSYFIDAGTTEEGGTVYKSENGGLDWDPLDAVPNVPIWAVSLEPQDPASVFASGQSGILHSPDAGSTWADADTGLPAASVSSIVPGAAPGLAWAATFGASVFKTLDGGATWQEANIGIGGFLYGEILIHPSANGTLWVSNYWGGGVSLLKSTNTGRTWSPSATGLPPFGIGAIEAMPGPPLRLFAASGNHDGVFRSDDGGATWTAAGPVGPAPMPYVSDLLVPPTDPTRIYAVGGTVLVSTDGGDTWEPASSETHYFNGRLFADSELPGVLYGHVDGLFQKSVDSGATWAPWNSGIGEIILADVAQSPSNPQILLAANFGDQYNGIAPLYRSVNRGATWTPSFSGIPPAMNLGSVRFDPAQPSRVYAAGFDGFNPDGHPVYRSLDGGMTWSPYDRGLRNDSAGPLAIAGNGSVVHVGANGGVFELTRSPDAPPSVSGASPTSGPKSGGTAVTVTGAGFGAAATVKFGETQSPDADTQNADHILATTPPGSPGLVSVTVTNPEPQFDTLKRAFVYDFDDVPPSAPYHDDVVALALREVTGGCGGGLFCPNAGLNRGQAAVQIEKGLHGADFPFPIPSMGPGNYYNDFDRCSGFGPYIVQFVQDGITAGCGDLNFCPENPVTRAQMVVFLLRAEHGPNYVPPPATGNVFADVPADAFAADYIEAAAEEGITAGCGNGNFCPGSTVTRAQAAVLIQRALPETP